MCSRSALRHARRASRRVSPDGLVTVDEHRTRAQRRNRPPTVAERDVALRLVARVDVAKEGRHRIVVDAVRVEGGVLTEREVPEAAAYLVAGLAHLYGDDFAWH